MIKEKWRTLNYEPTPNGRYIISDLGRIKNLDTGRILHAYIKYGYLRVNICFKRRHAPINVALAVIYSFRGKKKHADDIIYFHDGDRTNVSLKNIDILTPEEVFAAENKKLFISLNQDTFVLKNDNRDGEIWRRLFVHGYPTTMMVSNIGRIYNVMTGNYISPSIDCKQIYPFFSARANGHKYKVPAHRAVASLFVHNDRPEKFNVVNHLNEDRTDYRACNLEWTDSLGNTRYSINTGTINNRGENSGNASITDDTARRICEMLENGCRVCTICNELGVTRGVVRHIRDRTAWTHISEPYNFDHSMFLAYTNAETKEMIINLWKRGVPYDKIVEMTGWSKTTISVITRKYKKQMAENKQLQYAMVIQMNNAGESIDRISRETGLKKSAVRNIIINNTEF